jgi:hypothetical protein
MLDEVPSERGSPVAVSGRVVASGLTAASVLPASGLAAVVATGSTDALASGDWANAVPANIATSSIPTARAAREIAGAARVPARPGAREDIMSELLCASGATGTSPLTTYVTR